MTKGIAIGGSIIDVMIGDRYTQTHNDVYEKNANIKKDDNI